MAQDATVPEKNKKDNLTLSDEADGTTVIT